MSKYDLLTTYLKSQSPDSQETALYFKDLERILGTKLPPAARAHRPWWANTESHSHASSWLGAGWKIDSVDLSAERVVFTRISAESEPPRRNRGTYQNLRHLFQNLPPQQRQVVLTFSEVGGLIGHELPEAALRHRPWWANTTVSSQGEAWMAAGWRLQHVYPDAKLAVFRKKGEDPLRNIPRYVKEILEGPAPGRLGSGRLAKWIRLCRQVGWYFEGTVLYDLNTA